MKLLKKNYLLVLLLPLFAFGIVHKFYLSVTNINYSEKDKALQITNRIFIDDIERVLEERYDIDGQLGTDKEADVTLTYLEKYLRAKFVIRVDGEVIRYNFLGREYNEDQIVFYLEIPEVEILKVKSLSVESEILTDLFEEQQNVVHFKINNKKKSFVLIKENNKGMLNF